MNRYSLRYINNSARSKGHIGQYVPHTEISAISTVGIPMKRVLMVFTILILVLPITGMAQSTALATSQSKKYSRQALRDLMRSAHNSAQYQLLADYFRQQESSYRVKAAAEKMEWDRRAQQMTGAAQKYPRPVDSAHYLYDSYLLKADQSGTLAQHYEQLADVSQSKL